MDLPELLALLSQMTAHTFPAILDSVIARDFPVMRRLAVRQVEQHFIDIAPAPAFRRIVAFDDWMAGGVEMRRRVLVRGIVAAPDMTAAAADPQMQPSAAALEAFLPTDPPRRDG